MKKFYACLGVMVLFAVVLLAQTGIPGFVTIPSAPDGAQSPRIMYNVPLATGHGSISATTLGIAPATGTYKIEAGASLTAVGASCGAVSTVITNVIYRDPNAASGQTVALATFQTDGTNGTKGTVALASGSARPQMVIRALAGSAIQVSTTYGAGASCNPGPDVQITPVLTALGQ